MNFRIITVIVLYAIFSHPVLAIDPFYDGENGIHAQVFATHCLACHSSQLSGSQRNGAPSSVNWDTFLAAAANGNRAVFRAVERMNMPPGFSNLATLNQQQKDAMLAWQAAGFPRINTHARFDFSNQLLTLPVVNVGGSVFSASLQLVNLPGSTLGFGFVLESSQLTEESSANAATFFAATGSVEIPEIELLNSDDDDNKKVSVQMTLIPNSSPFTFEVTQVKFID